MIPLDWAEIEALDLGALQGAPVDGVIRRIHDDSRRAVRGDLFVALNSGTRFVDAARAAGAATLVPRDQHAALASLARLVRARSHAKVVAIVGSTGKTSTKDALAALCAAVVPTVAAEASRNNEIGLPLTVLRLEKDTAVLVTEMGMRGHGQIAELCDIARPQVVVVTGIGPEHLELVGTVADVARANSEAIGALPPGGIAVVPDDVPELEGFLGREDIELHRFSRGAVERIGGDLAAPVSRGSRWRFSVAGETIELELPFDQRHMAENVLAALTAYAALGLPLERAQEGASRIQLSAWRADVRALPGGGAVINDAYNANPTSMRAALLDLAERAGDRRRVAVLGEMAELGAESPRYHAEIATLLAELGIDVVIAVGERARAYLVGAVDGHWIADAAAYREVEDLVRAGDVVLVKASRSVGLEGIPVSIEKQAGAWSAS